VKYVGEEEFDLGGDKNDFFAQLLDKIESGFHEIN
jgi:hypothetical protein